MNDYAIYVGDAINTVSLWKRDGEKEYPIYANTRGQCEWYSTNPDVYENTETAELSDKFVEWLAHFHRVKEGLVDVDSMYYAKAVEEDRPEEEPRWFETEILNAIGNPGYTPEQEELLEWAHNEVEA